MTCTAYSRDFVPLPSDATTSHGRRGILRRILDAIYESRLKQAERDIARFIDRRGGRMTDETERQLTQHLLHGDWRL